MAHTTTRTVPSAVLGEYLSDVQAAWDFTKPSAFRRDVEKYNATRVRGLAPCLLKWYGRDIALGYLDDILARAEAQRSAEAQAKWQREHAEQRAAKRIEEPKAPKRRGRKPRRQSLDTRVHDKKLREAMVKVVNRNGRVNRGLRRLAKDAEGISEASVRRALDAWQADGQLTREGRGKGKTQSIKLHLDHPAWSGYLPSHPPTI
jgi:hypothetical protein